MPLLSSSDQQQLRELLAGLTRQVHLLFFMQTIDGDTSAATRQILDELPPLSGRIVIDEINVVLEREKASRYGVDRAPAVAIAYEETNGVIADSRIRFVGAPAGYAFMALVRAILLVGGAPSELTDSSRRRLSAVDRPVTLQVFTTPT